MMTVSEDMEIIVSQSTLTKRWIWSWLTATMAAGVTVTGTRSYETKAGAIKAGKAGARRLKALCVNLSRGDMI